MRQIVLDTETTGLDVKAGHRIIEIGCVEIVERRLTGRHFHAYINPGRKVDEGAIAVHGITDKFLENKPKFYQIFDELLDFINGAELVIHNATFDIGFLNQEFLLLHNENKRLSVGSVTDYCTVIDTLLMARQRHPAQRNNLDALCKRYGIDNSKRDLHGALLDAEILAEVYLAMTGGQVSFFLNEQDSSEIENELLNSKADNLPSRLCELQNVLAESRAALKVIYAKKDELTLHTERLNAITKYSGQISLWEQLE